MGKILAYLPYIFLLVKLYSFLFLFFFLLLLFSSLTLDIKFWGGVYLNQCCVSLNHTPETQKSGFSFQKDVFRGEGRTKLISLSIKCVFTNTWFTSNNTDVDGKQMCSLHYFFFLMKRNVRENKAFMYVKLLLFLRYTLF